MDSLDRSMAGIYSELHLATGSAEVVQALGLEVKSLVTASDDPALAEQILVRLASILVTRAGPTVDALLDLIASLGQGLPFFGEVVVSMLGASDEGIRDRVTAMVAEMAQGGCLTVDAGLVERIARADGATPFSASALANLGDVVRLLGRDDPSANPALALFRTGATRNVRRLAARLLDTAGERPDPSLVRDQIGDAEADFLAPYLEYSGATHLDLQEITSGAAGAVPCLEGLRAGERSLGPALLRQVISDLGWARIGGGLSIHAKTGVAIDGSFPFVVASEHARLLGDVLGAEPLWRRHLIVAQGGASGDGTARASEATVQRFRAYNLAHAELLDEILAVEPVDALKALRILRLLERVVADFAALFDGLGDDARRAPSVLERIGGLVLADLSRDRSSGSLSGDTIRRIQAFEDPKHLEDVTTLHGLKRYLHQQGLRLAFRLFRSYSGAAHTVDLLVTDERQILRREQGLRYLEFEPTPPVGTARLPFLVSLLAESFGRQILLGRKLPTVTVLGYGNEFQIYINYRNHPAFVRIDLSPPFRGGMIDLEYFAVSQYEMDQHPDLSLQGIQRLMRELDFDVSKDGLRLRARYDKERAVDLGDVVAKVGVLFDLLPCLMDVDWLIGDLDYPEGTRAEVAMAWAGFFARWGVLPAPDVLSASRRKIVVAVEPDPAGPREIAWTGRGGYRDRFSDVPPAPLAEKLRHELARRGLAPLVAEGPPPRGGWGQRWLDRAVLQPLSAAAARGELQEGSNGVERAPDDLFQREHEAVRLASALTAGGSALRAAVEMAELVRSVERQARFQTTGSIQGYAVQATNLPTAPRPVGLFVLRDGQGIVRLAIAAGGGVLHRERASRDVPWVRSAEIDAGELAHALRSYNYLGAGPGRTSRATDEELEELRNGFAAFHVTPVGRLRSDERVVPGTVASPGRATGFAEFHTEGRKLTDLDGCVLVARAVRPEDVPWIRHSAGIVSTGGGILSHVGLVALELAKPALIVEGSWSSSPSGAEVLVYRRPEWREEESTEGPYQVVCRLDLRHAEETLAEGDLVVVDGDERALIVLGHDAQALSLHQDLHELQRSSAALGVVRSDDEILTSRGRLLRATHQLERLLARMERPALVRHAVRELLVPAGASLSPEGRGGRSRLLSVLLRNPACAGEARASASLRLHDLRTRMDAARRVALDDIPLLVNPAEVLLARTGVRKMYDSLQDALELARAHGLDVGTPGDPIDVDHACRRRLREIRTRLVECAAGAEANPQERWRLRHLLPQMEQVERVLGQERTDTSMALSLERSDQELRGTSALRLVFGAESGGQELGPLVGGKAAFLGEIARVLGPSAVPPWFAVSDAAFREVLATSVPAPVLDRLGLSGITSLEKAIERITERTGKEAAGQASSICDLWQAMPLPARLVDEVASAYRSLSDRSGEERLVAIRSSTHEEDSDVSTWAGEFDTFLFVRGLAPVLEHLKLAWAGFWTDRAIERRRATGASPLARGGGIVVQRMVDARVSGVLHTVYAAANQLREMVINVGLGLGEGIVSGTVDVDHILVAKNGNLLHGDLQLRYRVGDKREQVVFDRERGTGTKRQETRYHQRFRAALEYVELCDLVRVASRLEEAFLQPLDVEFALEGQSLFILQARPIPLCDAAWRETLAHHPLRPDPTSTKELP
ncbi:MAG: PEP/pyruvate-binding domain-containing protein [Deltaproteobacteria bacterium]